MSNVIRLGDVVVPMDHRSITCGCGMVGWGPDTRHPGQIVAIEGGTVVCRSAPRVLTDELSAEGVSVFRTSIAGLRKVEAAMVPIRVGRDRVRS